MCLSGGCAANGTGGGTAVMPTTFWYKDVLPITQVRCANCHQAGGIGPFPLQTYAQAKPMAAAMRVLQTLALPLGDVAVGGEGGIRTPDGLAPATA